MKRFLKKLMWWRKPKGYRFPNGIPRVEALGPYHQEESFAPDPFWTVRPTQTVLDVLESRET